MAIPIKPKPCKGTDPLTRGLGCGKPTIHRALGLGKMCGCYSEFLLHTSAGKEIMRKAMIKGKADVKKESENKEKQQTKIQKEKLKTLSEYKNDLQKEINLIIRLIDNGHSCIATGDFNGKMNAGHYASVGSNPTLRYHLENIWLQSEHSNSWKAGDTLRYQAGIVRLYGNEYLVRLNKFTQYPPIKLTIDDIKRVIPICRGIVKWLKIQDRMFSTEERLSLRMKFNKEIGIYA